MLDDAIKTRIRIGQIAYTNCIPFYHQLSDFDFTKAVPAEVNQLMREGKLDLAPISSLEYFQNASKYYLIPDFGIGARDFSGSVILFSKEKIEGLNGLKIALTKESLSSIQLLKILLKFKYNFTNEFEVMEGGPEAMLETHRAALVIGDSALFYQPKEFVYKYDLSELWFNWTHKPFCFAVWAVRREFADRFPEEVAQFCKRLRQNLERNLENIELLVKDAMGLTFLDPRFSKVFGYLFNLNYGLDAQMRDGLEHFYYLAGRLQGKEESVKLDFFTKE